MTNDPSHEVTQHSSPEPEHREASPFCRIVREKLCTLELPYRLHNVAKGSAQREAFVARSGKQLIPYLVDPNTGSEMFESADIVSYLERTYATG